jgi:hypothetical protein
MSETESKQTLADRDLIESTWAESRDMIRRLEGSSTIMNSAAPVTASTAQRPSGRSGALGT